MRINLQSARRPGMGVLVGRFAAAASISCVVVAVTLRGGGPLAWLGPPVAFFATTFWAAGALGHGVRGQVGFAVAVVLSTIGCLLALVSTQAMSGGNALFTLGALIVPPAVASALGALLGLAIAFPDYSAAYLKTFKGFVAGGLAFGALAFILMEAGLLNVYSGLLLLAIPQLAGGTAASLALSQRPKTAARHPSLPNG